MSDIHGQKDMFDRMLKQINFTDKDKLYILGDVIDRGPNGIRLLLNIMDKPNIHMLLGNHEHMMKTYFTRMPPDHEALSLWINNGGGTTIEEFKRCSIDEKEKVLNFIKSIPVELRTTVNNKEFILCHAQPHPTSFKNDPFEDERTIMYYSSDEEFSVWHRYQVLYHSRYRDDPHGIIPDDNFKNKTVIFGHTPVCYYSESEGPSNSIRKDKNTINIDCGCAAIPYNNNDAKGRLACLRLDDEKEFYQEVTKLKERNFEER